MNDHIEKSRKSRFIPPDGGCGQFNQSANQYANK